jgi:predicted ATP-grasp superfamily ATP-dependent carboligase
MRILVTHCHSRMGYAVARSLAQAGHKIIAAGSAAPTMCRDLTGLEGEFAYPDPFQELDAFLQALEERAARYEVELFFPVHEETFVMSYHRARLARSAPVLAPDFAALMRAHDKAGLPEHARTCGIPVPETVLADSRGALQEAVGRVGLPAVLKPRFGSGANKTAVIRERSQLEKVSVGKGAKEFVVQSYFEGVGVSFAGLAWHGRMVALSGHRRLREIPITGGASTARATFDHAQMRAATERLLRHLQIDGVVMAEYRFNPSTGAYCLLELNPRYWGGVATAIRSAVDFPLLHLRAAIGELPAHLPVTPTRDVQGRWLLGETRAFFEFLRYRRWREAAAMLRSQYGLPVLWDDVEWRHPAAFCYQARAYYEIVRRHGNFGAHSSAKEAFFVHAAGAEEIARL